MGLHGVSIGLQPVTTGEIFEICVQPIRFCYRSNEAVLGCRFMYLFPKF